VQKVIYLVSSGKNQRSPFLPTLRKCLASHAKFYCFPPWYTTFDKSWTIDEPQCFDQVEIKYQC